MPPEEVVTEMRRIPRPGHEMVNVRRASCDLDSKNCLTKWPSSTLEHPYFVSILLAGLEVAAYGRFSAAEAIGIIRGKLRVSH
jgi:hypothetical protein